jgi:hypothetical protein
MSPDSGSNYFGINMNENFKFTEEKSVLSRSDELVTYSGDRSNKVLVNMFTTSDYLSPVLDLGRTHSIYVHNIINSNTSDENASSGGSLINKYISRTSVLAEGQDAEDVKIILTTYRPPNSDVKVWIKISNNEDGETFASKPWLEMSLEKDPGYSSLINENDFIEHVYVFPSSPTDRLSFSSSNTTITKTDILTGVSSGITSSVSTISGDVYIMDDTGYTPGENVSVFFANTTFKGSATISTIGKTAYTNTATGIVTYTADDGTTYTGYKQYATKIGLLSDNSAVVPKVADLRIIALQV